MGCEMFAFCSHCGTRLEHAAPEEETSSDLRLRGLPEWTLDVLALVREHAPVTVEDLRRIAPYRRNYGDDLARLTRRRLIEKRPRTEGSPFASYVVTTDDPKAKD